MSDNTLSSSAKKVQDSIYELGYQCRVVELHGSTRTADEAARAVSCQVGQIVKSLVFKTAKTKKALLVLASGSNRVDIKKLESHMSERVRMADPDFVRKVTGFAIGGVPPIGHVDKIETYVDEDLLQYNEIWAAAGNPKAMFKSTPADMVKMTQGAVILIK